MVVDRTKEIIKIVRLKATCKGKPFTGLLVDQLKSEHVYHEDISSTSAISTRHNGIATISSRQRFNLNASCLKIVIICQIYIKIP